VNAEDPDRNFMPQPGLVEEFVVPGGFGIRVDTHVRSGYRIPPNYDSMIGKLIVHGRDRTEAIAKMQSAIAEFRVGPIRTTLSLHQRLLAAKPFIEYDFDIHWVERLLAAPDAESSLST
jgi:acetyl-CoA carboxylase biotin carboxylase subunit